MQLKNLGVAACLASWMFCLPLLAQDDTLDWLNNYKEAIQEAKRTNKPIFLVPLRSLNGGTRV